jgi:Dolichyl-phosphate-mannose-protein mannosyltransferase
LLIAQVDQGSCPSDTDLAELAGDQSPAVRQLAPPAFEPAAVAHPAGRPTRISTAWSALGTGRGWPLALLLAVQAALTLRLIWSNTAFSDEALYTWAGRLELAHFLHGAPVPAFSTYFSGSPALYPPLAAIAADASGLAGARLLSMAMMLAATGMLHGITRRLFDRRSAFFAAGLFAGLAGAQFLGALATYDAMALCLVALAAWLAVLGADRSGPAAARLAAGAGVSLAVANAAKYASGLYDPVVIGAALLAAWQAGGRMAGIRAAAIVTGTLAVLLSAAMLAGGMPYLEGLTATTLARQPGSYPAIGLLVLSGSWLWVIALPAAIGVLVAACAQRGGPFALLAGLLFAAILLAPAEQAHIRTYTSLFKHVTYGAWFGCAVAGYAVAALSRVGPAAKAIAAFRVGVLATGLAVVPAIPTAARQYQSWPDTSRLMAVAARVIAAHPGPILADDDGSLLRFYLGRQVGRRPVIGTWYISYRGPGDPVAVHGLAGYADAIRHCYFAVVLLEFVDNQATDDQIWRDLATSGRYRIAASVPYSQRRSFLLYARDAR